MALRIAGLPVPGPTDLFACARAVAGWTGEAVWMAAALPERVLRLLDVLDRLVERISGVADRVDAVLERVDGLLVRVDVVATSAEELLGSVRTVAESAACIVVRARTVVEEAATTSTGAHDLLATYTPLAQRAAPLAARFIDELSEQEVSAAIRLVDQLPMLTERMETDIMPILATLDRVGPDVHALLEELQEVRQAINGIPGFEFFRRRGRENEER